MKSAQFFSNLMLAFNKYTRIICMLAVFMVSSQIVLNAQDSITHDFNDGEIFPFRVGKTDQLARVKVIDKKVQTFWDEDLYNGTNSGRKAQFMPNTEITYTQEFWTGFYIKIHSDYMAENTNTEAGLMQIWGFNGSSANHYAMIKFEGRDGGQMVWQHRYNSVSSFDHYLIQDNFPRNKFVKIVARIKLGDVNKGIVQVWVDDVLKVNKTNQRIGWGNHNANGQTNGSYSSGASFGQYNSAVSGAYGETFDSEKHWFDGHMAGETRTVTYDDVSIYVGSNGYSMVDPEGGQETSTPTPTPPVQNGALVHITKRNATGFAIDGGNGGSNGQNVTLSKANTADEGQLWVEIDRGNGFYSYEKYGTNYSLDGDRGGAIRQNVYLWQTSATNQNQQWKKEAVGDGGYKLIKRNATGFAINGGSGGVEGRDINMWSSTSTNQNLQWYITPVASAENVRLEAEDFDRMSGIQTEASTESGDNVGYINDGDWLRFDDVNLSGISNMDARIASNFTGGTIEVRTGSTSGTLIGTIDVNNTGGHQNWTTLSTSISNTNGTKDVYLVFSGGNGYLFNVNWIEFNTSSRSSKDIDESIEAISDIKLYPNPVISTTTIENAANSTIVIYDINGSVVFTKSIISDNEIIDLSKLTSGIYYTEVNGEETISVVKIIKN